MVMIGVSLDASADDARRFAAKHRLGWRQALGGQWASSEVTKQYEVRAIPAVFLIGPDGKLVAGMVPNETIKELVERGLKVQKDRSEAEAPVDGNAPSEPENAPAS